MIRGRTVFVVGRVLDVSTDYWECRGVFSTRKAALNACTDPLDFIGPVRMNKPLPHDPTPWPGAVYPFAEGEK